MTTARSVTPMPVKCQRYECTDRARYVWAIALETLGPILDRTVRLCGTCSVRGELLDRYAHQFLGWVK